jgi:hypothetical protein
MRMTIRREVLTVTIQFQLHLCDKARAAPHPQLLSPSSSPPIIHSSGLVDDWRRGEPEYFCLSTRLLAPPIIRSPGLASDLGRGERKMGVDTHSFLGGDRTFGTSQVKEPKDLFTTEAGGTRQLGFAE